MVDDEIVAEYLQTVVKFIRQSPQAKRAPVLILLDEAEQHLARAVRTLSLTEPDVHLLCFPANCTGWLQPLDVACFGPLKKLWRQLIRLKFPETQVDLVRSVRNVLPVALNNRNIEGGFKRSGVWPVNGQEIRKMMEERVGQALVRKDPILAELGQVQQLQQEEGKKTGRRGLRQCMDEAGTRILTSAALYKVIKERDLIAKRVREEKEAKKAKKEEERKRKKRDKEQEEALRKSEREAKKIRKDQEQAEKKRSKEMQCASCKRDWERDTAHGEEWLTCESCQKSFCPCRDSTWVDKHEQRCKKGYPAKTRHTFLN